MVDFSKLPAALFDPVNPAVVFSHMDEKTGKFTHLNITALLEDPVLRARPVKQTSINVEFAEFCLHNRGIEQHRLERLRGQEIREPILIAFWGDGSHLMIDGHHRYVSAWLDQTPLIKIRTVPVKLWQKYRITGIDDMFAQSVLTGHSGIA